MFVSGNHDSDSLERDLAQRGAVVLTERGRLNADGTYGDVIVDVAGLRVAGYSDPFERRAGEGLQGPLRRPAERRRSRTRSPPGSSR